MSIKNIRSAVIRIENITYDKEENFFNSDVYVSVEGGKEFLVDSYIDISTFLINNHRKTNKRLKFENFKDFSKNYSKKEQFYFENRVQYNNYQQQKKSRSYSFLNSCNCGIPYCSGITNGVNIYEYSGYFIYKVGKNEGYKSGILDSGFRKIKISKTCIENIRKQLSSFLK
jgi:hypothetical protein